MAASPHGASGIAIRNSTLVLKAPRLQGVTGGLKLGMVLSRQAAGPNVYSVDSSNSGLECARGCMADKGLRLVFRLMLNDSVFSAAFAQDPLATLEKYGISLTPDELKLLLSSRTVDSAPLGEVLDDRIKRRSDDLI